MAYTEVKERNNRKYYYRVISLRKGEKVSKKRIYLGKDLIDSGIRKKEREADDLFYSRKTEENINKLKPKIINILKKYGIKKAGIFGSYARGNQKNNSDIDIVVSYPENFKGKGFGFIKIEDDLKSALKKNIDLITYNSINPYLKKRILNEEIRLI